MKTANIRGVSNDESFCRLHDNDIIGAKNCRTEFRNCNASFHQAFPAWWTDGGQGDIDVTPRPIDPSLSVHDPTDLPSRDAGDRPTPRWPTLATIRHERGRATVGEPQRARGTPDYPTGRCRRDAPPTWYTARTQLDYHATSAQNCLSPVRSSPNVVSQGNAITGSS